MRNKNKVVRTNLADQVCEILRERILDRQYEPGEKLTIDQLARELGTSSSPVREALARLTAEGLVASSTFMGFSVAPIRSRQWFEQLMQYRTIVEGWAAREAARLRSQKHIEAMAETLHIIERGHFGPHMKDYEAVSRADETFHLAILDAAGNAVLAQTVRDLHPHLHHARLFNAVPQDAAQTATEHRRIFDAIVRGDAEEAARAMENHLKASWHRYDSWRDDA